MASIVKLDANEHPIKSVTVFKSKKAEVVRTFKVSLKAGQSKIQIRHLPDSIDTESARVTGLGDAQLFDVVCSIGSGIKEIDTASTAEIVRKLDAQKDVLVKDLETIDDVSETIVTYSKSLSGDSVPPRQAERFFESILSRSRERASARADLEEEILQLSRQIDLLSSAEEKKQGRANGEVTVVIMAKRATEVELRLTYLVRNATWTAAYELHATTEAGVPASSVSLHYRARVTQSTGEGWTNVELTLSTADMDLSNQTIPVLRPTKIRPPSIFGFAAGGQPQTQQLHPQGLFGQAIGQPMQQQQMPQQPMQQQQMQQQPMQQQQMQQQPMQQQQMQQQPMQQQQMQQMQQIQQMQQQQYSQAKLHPLPTPAGVYGSQAPPPAAPRRRLARRADVYFMDAEADFDVLTDEEEEAPEEAAPPIGEPTSVVHESPLALTYHVEGASGVPSDGVPHQVSVAVLPFEAKIQHVAVPKVRPVAYLQASVKNTSDYRLLPGTVHAFVDDSFVSKTSIAHDVAPGDVFSCTLGADPATRIRYARTSKRADDDPARERSAFSEQWAATAYRSRTTVTNRHPFPLRALVLRDAVPVSEDDKRVSVVLRRPAGLAELEQGKELSVSAEDGACKDEKRIVRWGKVVDGKGGRKEGLFEWVFEVGAGEEVTIETEWDVKAPVSLRWIESA